MGLKNFKKWKRIDRWLQVVIIAIAIIICADLLSGQTITTLTIGIFRLDNNVTITSGQIRVPWGLTGAPSLTFFGDPSTGIWGDTNEIRFSNLGTEVLRFAGDDVRLKANEGFGWTSGTPAAGIDTKLVRDGAANTLALKNDNNDQTQRWYGANGAYFQIKTSSELLTILAGPTTDTTMTIPANAVVRGVAVFVVTVIPAPAITFTVSGTTSGTLFNTAAVGVAAGSNDVGTQNTPYKNGAAQTIRITPNANPGAATGQVRIVLMYEIPSPPTS